MIGLAARLREELAKDGGRKLIRNFPMHMYAFEDGRIG